MPAKLPVHIIVALTFLALSGCSTVAYYTQAAGGQWALLHGREATSAILRDEGAPPPLRQSLESVEEILDFARQSLVLPVGETYAHYVDLKRDYVVWNVLAAPPDSLKPKQWCYPILGCQSYRGYFDPTSARQLAGDLTEEGWDTWAPGVIAYSSLGWFDDPVLSTFAYWPEDQLAGLIFHELSHKVLYIAGDTTFNESYATAVELEGLPRYLRHRGQPEKIRDALARQRVNRDFVEMVTVTAARLKAVYAQPGLSRDALLSRKADLIQQLRASYDEKRQHWPEPTAYSSFFRGDLNNARIASVGTYHRWVPAFRQLFRQQQCDFGRFHDAAVALSRLPREEREQALESLAYKAEKTLDFQRGAGSGTRPAGCDGTRPFP